jgi:UDP-N-acetylglucosamine 4,6-dehydratase/5-epimerase
VSNPFAVFDGQSVLVTGGTGSFGKHFVKRMLERANPERLAVFSRDELKQFHMANELAGDKRMRFFLGDVRDRDRLYRAFDGVDIVVHAAALKQIPSAEYNPFEYVKTNIVGAQNIIDAAIDRGVKRVIALSTDKASSPANLYGATKLVSDRLFVAGNAYVGGAETRFALVRYGNVMGSRGSVVDKLRRLAPDESFLMTDARMTRFWITLDQAVNFVAACTAEMRGGEIFVPKLPSMKLADLVEALAPEVSVELVGIRPGEKLHEEMISENEARRTLDRGDHYCVAPDIQWSGGQEFPGEPVPDGFRYASDINDVWLDRECLLALTHD